jgi:hypothetical protein
MKEWCATLISHLCSVKYTLDDGTALLECIQWLVHQEGNQKQRVSGRDIELGHCVLVQGRLKMPYKYGNGDPNADNRT